MYDGDDMTQELNGIGSAVAVYTRGSWIDEPLAVYGGVNTSYFQADGLGSVTSLTDGSGAPTASYAYDSFGNLTASTGTVTNPYRYTGREFDPETGLYYERARYYDPTAGRFLSEGPIEYGGGVNFYPYVSDRPLDRVDPFGYLQMGFDVTYIRLGFFQAFWHAGEDIWFTPILSATCGCQQGGYKLNITIRFPIHIVCNSPRTLAHEQEHNSIEEEFFRRQSAKCKAFEKTYPSLVECDYYREKYVAGFPGSGRTPDLMSEILADFQSQELTSAEEEVDNWFDVFFFHRGYFL